MRAPASYATLRRRARPRLARPVLSRASETGSGTAADVAAALSVALFVLSLGITIFYLRWIYTE